MKKNEGFYIKHPVSKVQLYHKKVDHNKKYN